MGGMRVAYTLEQCWHDVPGGTAVAALEVARRLAPRPDVTLVGVAGRHRHPPAPPWRAPIPIAQLSLGRVLLYEAWLRLRRPRVESVTGPIDVAHATGIVPCATAAPLVVTFADVAFLHEPDHFSRQGLRVLRRSLDVTRDAAQLVLTPSEASRRELQDAGIDGRRIRVVPWGVDVSPATQEAIAAVRRHYQLPERFVLYVGTLEPREEPAPPRRCGRPRRLTRFPWSWSVRTGGATPFGTSPATCGSSGSCPAMTSLRCTQPRRSSRTRANGRGSAFRSSRPWLRARPLSPAPGPPRRRPPAGPRCSSIRWMWTPSPRASTQPTINRRCWRRRASPRAGALTWEAAADATLAAYREALGVDRA